MQQYLRALSPKAEFAIVLIVAFGYIVFGNVFTLFRPTTQIAISETSLKTLLIYELVILSALSMLLHARGWNLQRIGLAPSIKETFLGIALVLFAYVAYIATWLIVRTISRQMGPVIGYTKFIVPGYDLGTAIAVSAVNPVFEEIFLSGYVISALKEQTSRWTAINISIVLRLLCHLYQGTLGIICILPVGLIFTYWYARRGRLWPIVVAHSVIDLIGLLAYRAL